MENKKVKKEHLDHFSIASFTYYEGVDVFDQLKIGSPLELKLEPDNPYDNRA